MFLGWSVLLTGISSWSYFKGIRAMFVNQYWISRTDTIEWCLMHRSVWKRRVWGWPGSVLVVHSRGNEWRGSCRFDGMWMEWANVFDFMISNLAKLCCLSPEYVRYMQRQCVKGSWLIWYRCQIEFVQEMVSLFQCVREGLCSWKFLTKNFFVLLSARAGYLYYLRWNITSGKICAHDRLWDVARLSLTAEYRDRMIN